VSLKLRPPFRPFALSGIRVGIAIGIPTESQLAVSFLFVAVARFRLVVFALF
jgi:hypothetical protein